MEISSRGAKILERLTEEYIKLIKPVSSELLEKKYDLGVCPATIRIEMQRLTKEGYLYQPYTSAGRIPTDKAYRFFVNAFKQRVYEEIDTGAIEKVIKKREKNVFDWLSCLTESLAEEASAFVVGGLIDSGFFSRQGWSQVLKEPEFEDKDLILSFVELVRGLENKIGDMHVGSGVTIYIGKESPFEKSDEFSIILFKCNFPQKKKGFVSILGPKRMSYRKNINLLNCLADSLRNSKDCD